MTGGEAPRGSAAGYWGYEILSIWVEDHWVHKVFQRWEWVDTFLSLDDAKTAIDHWRNAP